MEKNNEIYRMLIDSLSDCLIDKKGIKRKVLAVFLTGSFARNSATPASDLDLALIVRPSKYDYLTSTKISHQEVIHYKDGSNNELFEALPQALDLAATKIKLIRSGLFVPIQMNHISLRQLDIRIISVPDYYKQLRNMNPNIFDMYHRGPVWINFKNNPNWFDRDQSINLIAKLQSMPTKYKNVLNLPHLLAAILGISSHLKPQSLKMVDTVKSLTSLAISIVRLSYSNCELPKLLSFV